MATAALAATLCATVAAQSGEAPATRSAFALCFFIEIVRYMCRHRRCSLCPLLRFPMVQRFCHASIFRCWGWPLRRKDVAQGSDRKRPAEAPGDRR